MSKLLIGMAGVDSAYIFKAKKPPDFSSGFRVSRKSEIANQ
jgi:hypothetical protein